MASISRDPNGNYTVQVVGGDGKRRSIRLGSVNKKTAESVKLKVEHLNALVTAKLPMDTETAQWVGKIGDDLAAKLAAAKLIPARVSQHLGAFLAGYVERRTPDSKPATIENLSTVCNDLTRYFGDGQPLREVTAALADGFRSHYLNRKLAAATAARRLKTVRMLFKHAAKMQLIDANPFADVTIQSVLPAGRKAYVTPADTAKILAECNPTWRILVALARFGGLRCPSEVLSLKWSDVNWATERMTVPSCKTEHIPGKAYRVVPIFAALRPYLRDAFELAADGAEYVVSTDYRAAAFRPGGWKNCNLRTTFLKIIRRAGVKPWPRLFQNLRASCETDLMASHPIHAVTAWIGNSPTVAMKHYLQVLDADFDKASRGGAESGAVVVQNAVQSPTATQRHGSTPKREPLENVGDCQLSTPSVITRPSVHMGRVGVEPTSNPL